MSKSIDPTTLYYNNVDDAYGMGGMSVSFRPVVTLGANAIVSNPTAGGNNLEDAWVIE